MKRVLWLAVFLAGPALASQASKAALEALKAQIDGDPVAAPALQAFARENLLAHCTNPVFVREARRQNGRKVPLAQIQTVDKEWIASSSTSPFKASLLDSAASKEVRKVAAAFKAVKEAFLMDDQGAVVGETNLTSDYWQGDEKKWTEAFKGGQGGVYIAPAEFDASADAVLQQISLPLFDEAGKAVGAVTWGIVLDKIDWRQEGGKK